MKIALAILIIAFLSISCGNSSLQNAQPSVDALKVPEKVELQGRLKSPSGQSLADIQEIIGTKRELHWSRFRNYCTKNIESRYLYEDEGIILYTYFDNHGEEKIATMLLSDSRYLTTKGVKVGDNIYAAATKYGTMAGNPDGDRTTFELVDYDGMQVVFEAVPFSMNNPNENITSIRMTVSGSICNETSAEISMGMGS
jgi:hypothetical protein